jgi:hypothetical protein
MPEHRFASLVVARPEEACQKRCGKGGPEMANEHEKKEESAVDLQKRETLRRMIASTAFVAPVVASFPISGLTIDKAVAQISNQHFTDPFFRLFS